MKINKFEITETEDNISVFVEIDGANDRDNPKGRFKTPDLMLELEKKDAANRLGECIQEASLYNWRTPGLTGTWIFSKKTKKVKKPLDKPVEDVIIQVEKEVKPKPVRKRRTRSSTKKVSTGE
tara:strand:- start:13 stop:381 length:369 start_codon:yes stop_codon:yes gene_type:complete